SKRSLRYQPELRVMLDRHTQQNATGDETDGWRQDIIEIQKRAHRKTRVRNMLQKLGEAKLTQILLHHVRRQQFARELFGERLQVGFRQVVQRLHVVLNLH